MKSRLSLRMATNMATLGRGHAGLEPAPAPRGPAADRRGRTADRVATPATRAAPAENRRRGIGGTSGGTGGSGAGGMPCTPPTGGVMINGAAASSLASTTLGPASAAISATPAAASPSTKAQRLTSHDGHESPRRRRRALVGLPEFHGGGVTFDTHRRADGAGRLDAADITAALDDAAQAGIHIQFTFFSFDTFKTATMPPHNLAPISRARRCCRRW